MLVIRTKATEDLLSEIQRRHARADRVAPVAEPRADLPLHQLVTSIKMASRRNNKLK